MTEQDLQQLRREKWRLDGKAIRTIEQARAFVEGVGFCLMYPVRPAMPVPTFIGAFVGSRQSPADLAARLLRSASGRGDRTYGARCCASSRRTRPICLRRTTRFSWRLRYFLISMRWWASATRSSRPRAGPRSAYSQLACDAFELIRRDGPISKQKLQEALGGSVSLAALDKALGELLAKLRITRVDYKAPRRFLLGCALSLVAGRGARRRGTFGAAGALGAALKISGLCGRRRADGTRVFLRKICGAVAGEGSGKRAAGGARVELRACEWEVDAADHAREGSGECLPPSRIGRRSRAARSIVASRVQSTREMTDNSSTQIPLNVN